MKWPVLWSTGHILICKEGRKKKKKKKKQYLPWRECAFTDHYEFVRAIGRGSYGQVALARHRPTGAEVAVKVQELNEGASG
uniref:Protein kinase domain-containing protein n=1 Tax=Sciurus vulgaris TaxID=55149 RepID=A0A8D2AJL1_SCIVU